MTMRTQSQYRGVFALLRRYRRNRDGIAAVEFALLVPVLLLLYLGTMEISTGVSVNKRIARVAATTADLVAQQEQVNRNQLDEIMKVSESILFPYYADNPRVTIIGINVSNTFPEGGRTVWSRRMEKDGSFVEPVAENQDIWVPDRLRIEGTFLLMARAEINYLPLITWVTDRNPDGSPAGIPMSERYWFHPRLVNAIDCTNC